ncbi:AP-5 complex subunit zeta-1 isoform X2 [Candoia aspera]|uniref:AP-5 complex subunit zeta-1 isoform X2 n=1 Tax=Candoia aspera TaxID=51853 RepID=UPI002FD801E0
MYSAGTGSLLQQAREIQDDELKKFTSRISGFLQNQDFGNETIDSLQRLFLIVSATKYSRKLEGRLVQLLQTTLYLPTSPEQVQILCSAILREIPFGDDLSLPWDRFRNTKLLSLAFSTVQSQYNKRRTIEAVGQHVVKILEGRLPEDQNARPLLPLLSKVISSAPLSLNEDQINLLSKRMVDWLRYASLQQGVSPATGGFFNPRARQPGPVTEVDGTVATDFFTVLSVGQSYTEDQWLNMQAFSMLRKWLLCYGSDGTSNPSSDDKSEVDGSLVSMVSVTSTSGRLLLPRERLREKAFEYCQRLLEQSNRRALKKADGELQKACLVEAVTIMDIICRQDSSYVYRSLSCLKNLHGRISGDLSYARVLIPIAQFFLNHSETAAVDSEAVYRHLFAKVPAQLFHNLMLAFQFLQFCRQNVGLFTENLSIFRQSTPNLFKFLAWNSPPLIVEYTELLPALLGPDNALEIFHLLLDLPCLTAALDTQLRSVLAPLSERAAMDPASKPVTCLEAFRHPQYRGLFHYLLRVESSPSDPGRLTPLRQILGSMASNPRVGQCAKSVPVLLQLFFRSVCKFADEVLANKLTLAALERSDQLYEIPWFKAEVFRVMSSQLQVLCRQHPSLVVELSKQLLEFSGTVSNIQTKEDLFTHVVWAIGEYASVSHDKRCTVEQINTFFEVLEAMLFEITQLRPSANIPKYSPRVIAVLMTALTKLASRSQDLIPRVSLFLSKMKIFIQNPAVSSVYSAEDAEAILTRATELMNLLKMPSVAQFVLRPSSEDSSHQETHIPLLLAMKMTSQLLEGGTGSVPG